MSFSGHFVPDELGGRRLGVFASVMSRIVLASLAAGLVVGLGSAGMLFTMTHTSYSTARLSYTSSRSGQSWSGAHGGKDGGNGSVLRHSRFE
jgi:hypothetical protein